MSRRYLVFIVLLLTFIANLAVAQNDNLVPNPSFEIFKNRPLGWFYKGAHFTHTVKYWFSPSYTSPDAYGPKVRIPQFWQNKGFGNVTAALDDAYVGITVFGCDDGKSHCREYVSVELKEALIVGQKYTFSFYVLGKAEGLKVKSLGFMFSEQKPNIDIENDDKHSVFKVGLSYEKQGWEKLTLTFIAKEASHFVTIGNFKNDDASELKKESIVGDKFGYFYLDNISLTKELPFLAVPFVENDLRLEKIEEGDEIILKNVHFDTDKSVLRPQSEQELNHLVEILNSYPKMQIEIRGYTDNQGKVEYNQELSQARAEEVGLYILNKGVVDVRFKCVGKGELNPLFDNETMEGRQKNRRVSFKIIKIE